MTINQIGHQSIMLLSSFGKTKASGVLSDECTMAWQCRECYLLATSQGMLMHVDPSGTLISPAFSEWHVEAYLIALEQAPPRQK